MVTVIVFPALQSLHEPAMADHQRLTRHCIRLERGKKEGGFSHVVSRCEFAINGFLEHDIADDRLLRYSKHPRLLRDLLVDERRAHEPWTDNVCPHTVLRTFFGNDFGKAHEAVFGSDIGFLEKRGFLRMYRAHVDDAAAALL